MRRFKLWYSILNSKDADKILNNLFRWLFVIIPLFSFAVLIVIISVRGICTTMSNLSYVSTAFTGVGLCNAAQTLFFERKVESKYGFEYNRLLDSIGGSSHNRHIILCMRIISIIMLAFTTVFYIFGNELFLRFCLVGVVIICCLLMCLWTVFSLPSLIECLVLLMIRRDIFSAMEDLHMIQGCGEIPNTNGSAEKILSEIYVKLRSNAINDIIKRGNIIEYDISFVTNVVNAYEAYEKSVISASVSVSTEKYKDYLEVIFFQMYDITTIVMNMANRNVRASELLANYKKMFFYIEEMLQTHESTNNGDVYFSIYAGIVLSFLETKNNPIIECIKSAVKWHRSVGIRAMVYVFFEIFNADSCNSELLANIKNIMHQTTLAYRLKDIGMFIRNHKDIFLHMADMLFLLEKISLSNKVIEDIILLTADDFEKYPSPTHTKRSAVMQYIETA